MGDAALPCFQFAKQFRKAPQQIAQNLATQLTEKLLTDGVIERVVATWPYINFFVKTAALAEQVLSEIKEEGEFYGIGEKRDEVVLIESPGPNTNKPLHLGHVRNMLLWNALGNILSFSGYDVHAINIYNDRGVHICKSMLAYKLFGNNENPDIKSDHYVGKRYVRYAKEAKENPELEQQAQTMLEQREAWDKDTVDLRSLMRDRCINGQAETFKMFWTDIEKDYFESDHYIKWAAIVKEWVDSGLFTTKENWSIIYTDEKLWEKVVLRSNGTSVYITQDIALWKLRYDDWSMDRMIYVVGNEQEDHFKFLFSIFKALDLPFADKCHHLSYGMVALPDGKMKSREWTVIDADDIVTETHEQSYTMLKERYPELGEEELNRRASIIWMWAIKFFFIKYDAVKDFIYDKNTSLRFDGETGPYIQYTYARCCSILKKAADTSLSTKNVDYALLTQPEEKLLLVHLNEFADTIQESGERYQPYLVARHALETAHLFNSFYQKHMVVNGENKALSSARCALVEATQTVIKTWLQLLWIDVLEEM